MHPRCAINTSLPQKNFKLLLQRKFCCIPNQSLTQPAGRFIPSSQAGSNVVFFNHVGFMLSRYQNLLRVLRVRNFSSSRTLSALEGSNRSKEERQAKILYASLTLVVLLVACLVLAIQPHEDYVILKAEAGK